MPDDRLSAALRPVRARARLAYASPRACYGSQRDVDRLLAALDAVLKLADEWTEGSYGTGSALDEDRAWVRAECGAKVRDAITRELTGGEAADDRL